MNTTANRNVHAIHSRTASVKARNKAFWQRTLRTIRLLAVIYLLICLLMMFFENSLIFPKRRYPAGDWNPVGLNYEDISFQSADGTKLHGWYIRHPQPKAIVLFCHGNFEHVADNADYLRAMCDEMQVSIFAFDYRGYGRSEGKANEAGVLADGHAAMDWLAQRENIKPTDVVLVGRSLGGAVAVDMAAAKGARGLVLERTFSSAQDVGARAYPWLPVRLLMRTELDSVTKIRNYTGPLLQTHGTDDRVVPIDLGRKLFEACPSSRKEFLEIPGGGHNDGYDSRYWSALQEFLWTLPKNNAE